jgi:hypothetical protein
MAKKEILASFIGVPEETLRSIGTVTVMAARLDHQRMQILEHAAGVPVATSAGRKRSAVTEQLKDSVLKDPINRLAARFDKWHREVLDLLDIRDDLSHSDFWYQVWGDGRSGMFMARPKTGQVRAQFSLAKLDEVVERLHDACSDGQLLVIDAMTLAQPDGVLVYAANLRKRQEWEDTKAAMLAEAERLRAAGG